MIRVTKRTVPNVRIEVDFSAEPDRILGDKPLQAGVVVARPRVTPTVSLARNSTPSPMRLSVMRPGPAYAWDGDRVLVPATTSRGAIPPLPHRHLGQATPRSVRLVSSGTTVATTFEGSSTLCQGVSRAPTKCISHVRSGVSEPPRRGALPPADSACQIGRA